MQFIPFNHQSYYLFKLSKKILFIYFRPGRVFIAAHIWWCFCQTGALSRCNTRASHCSGFSCCRVRALGRTGFNSCSMWPHQSQLPGSSTGSVAAACGLSSCSFQPLAQAQLLWHIHVMWNLPRSGMEPMSPALAGRFCTTEPPGKPSPKLF